MDVISKQRAIDAIRDFQAQITCSFSEVWLNGMNEGFDHAVAVIELMEAVDVVAEVMAFLDAQPTVDAVPVSFIRDLINLARKAGADSHAESLEVLLADWAETRQVPKTNISPCEGCEDYIYGGGCKRDGKCVAR